MIHFFVNRPFAYTVSPFVSDWAPGIKQRMRIGDYGTLLKIRSLDPGIIIFSDLERFTGAQRRIVSAFCEAVLAAAPGMPVLNHPGRALCRYDLLRALHREGINDFNAHRLGVPEHALRYPLFLRNEDDHDGALTPLLHSREERLMGMLRLAATGHRPGNIIQVEFCDVRSSDGLYRKYSAFRIGDRIIPGHLLFGEKWLLKDTDVSTEETRREQREFMDANPHEKELRRIFDIAGIGFGRVDYGVTGGRIRVWEINTNPVLIKPRSTYKPYEIPFKEDLAIKLTQAFEAIDSGGAGEKVPVKWVPGKLLPLLVPRSATR